MPRDSAQRLSERVRSIAAEVAKVHAADVDGAARFPNETLNALKEEQLLSVLVPKDLGGPELSLGEVATMCEHLAHHCASSGMIFAMHQIQVACIARHRQGSAAMDRYLEALIKEQRLIASVTSEVGIGGEMRASIACVEARNDHLELAKNASTISYGEQADDLLVTARRNAEAPRSDQVLVLLKRGEFTLERTSAWNTLGMRGTCSPGFKLTSKAPLAQILPTGFSEIASLTMVPYSHILWASVWLGIAASAVSTARAYVRQQARSNPGTVPPAALRLAEVASSLQTLRALVQNCVAEADQLIGARDDDALLSIGFAFRLNNLKVSASQLVAQIVHQALLICGIMGYKNDSPYSLGRQLRDAQSAALMISNDRIYATNASMLLVLKDD